MFDQVNQRNQPVFEDFSSFGTGPGGVDVDATEAACRRNYESLVSRIKQYERSLDVHNRLMEDSINIQNGENTFIFNARIDNGVVFAEQDEEECELFKAHTIAYLHYHTPCCAAMQHQPSHLSAITLSCWCCPFAQSSV